MGIAGSSYAGQVRLRSSYAGQVRLRSSYAGQVRLRSSYAGQVHMDSHKQIKIINKWFKVPATGYKVGAYPPIPGPPVEWMLRKT
jgi:hypothetical protein